MDPYQVAYWAGLASANGYLRPLLIAGAAGLFLALAAAFIVSLRIGAWRHQ